MSQSSAAAAPFAVKVVGLSEPVDGIRIVRLKSADGRSLPAFEPGGHLSLRIPPGRDRKAETWRSYSLIVLPDDAKADPDHPIHYRLGVLREPRSTGGSSFIHDELRIGDVLQARLPPNGFALRPSRDTVHFIAGGIGITPIISLLSAHTRRGGLARLHYVCRDDAQHLYAERLAGTANCEITLHASRDPQRAFSVEALLASLPPHAPLYVCGPRRLIDEVTAQALARGWEAGDIHAEFFAAEAPEGAEPFEVQIASTGQVVEIPADKTIIDMFESLGVPALYDCRQGHCGLCSVAVQSGEVVHRDSFLSDEEKAAGKVMQICVSRGKGRVVLDM